MIPSPSVRSRFCVAPLALLAACASTTLDATWVRPAFAGNRIEGKVLVVGVARDNIVRHVYEDDMVQKLDARGVTAVRSYESIPDVLHKDDTDRLLAAAQKAGARYLLSTALVGREVEEVATQLPAYEEGTGFRRWYNDSYDQASDAPEVRTYAVYILQTSLTDVGADRVEWTARTRTTSPSDMQKEMRGFVDVILGAMTKSKLVRAAQ